MSHESAVDWLEQDTEDSLDAGRVGLYELVWALNSSEFRLDAEEKIRIATLVAERFLRRGTTSLYEVTWPDSKIVRGPLDPSILHQPDAIQLWDDPEKTYTALWPNDVPRDDSPLRSR